MLCRSLYRPIVSCRRIRPHDDRICGKCYSGLYNDIGKLTQNDLLPLDATRPAAETLPEQFRRLPRGCKNDYNCPRSAYHVNLPQTEKCTRCRSVAICAAVPHFAQSQLNRAYKKAVTKYGLTRYAPLISNDDNDDDHEDDDEEEEDDEEYDDVHGDDDEDDDDDDDDEDEGRGQLKGKQGSSHSSTGTSYDDLDGEAAGDDD
ncbi:hypothetical protein PTSG_07689 [Salpingoeca rosetta]|uniref:Uncharacterized protein n=1 Tax=Salpingoeca rosetta (strain ATCC 50818 / BSB-021) TaxID=946362 RepID=F2UHH3_SALR5|nr:uncharacterized protein PTSG_07689 [Salpingoeca rosetta]EGD76572.1 hypothetical protein PTSG_07689 [Salpingoeca rosetta]|eukprot:XP_004991486.1 hypothetical protein PTSG_07689 [Salpingoeca rosetta]